MPWHARLVLTWTGLALLATTALIGAWLIATSIRLSGESQPMTISEPGGAATQPGARCASAPSVYSQLPPCRYTH